MQALPTYNSALSQYSNWCCICWKGTGRYGQDSSMLTEAVGACSEAIDIRFLQEKWECCLSMIHISIIATKLLQKYILYLATSLGRTSISSQRFWGKKFTLLLTSYTLLGVRVTHENLSLLRSFSMASVELICCCNFGKTLEGKVGGMKDGE